MASKAVQLPEIGTVKLYKHKASRSIKLSVNATGTIRVTMPFWVPYSAGIAFAKQKQDWLKAQVKPVPLLTHEMHIGKQHQLIFKKAFSPRVTTRVSNMLIQVTLPPDMLPSAQDAQNAARKACIRALRKEAEDILPGRLRELAAQHNFIYRSVEIKHLKSRWGSCNQHREIILNCFLMQLPWHLIDYVLLHELLHTRLMAHGPRFWKQLEAYIPNLPVVRREMRQRRPTLTL